MRILKLKFLPQGPLYENNQLFAEELLHLHLIVQYKVDELACYKVLREQTLTSMFLYPILYQNASN